MKCVVGHSDIDTERSKLNGSTQHSRLNGEYLPITNPLRERSLVAISRKWSNASYLQIPSPIRWQATGRYALRKTRHSSGAREKFSLFSLTQRLPARAFG